MTNLDCRFLQQLVCRPFLGIVLLASACFLILPGSARPESPAWSRLADGMSMALWSPSGCLDVPPLITIDVDPSRYRFSVHYFREERLDQPLDILEWQRRTGHHLIFNAGLFRENYAYLGLLYANGRSLGGRQHATWLGLFAAEPTIGGTPPAKIFDLAVEAFDEQRPPYREAAQSLMLLDQNGTIRVRQTGKHSHQTIVGEQDNGHIVLFKTTRPASLYDLGQCIHVEFPAVRRAMAMDGGSSSDMVLAPSLSRNAGKVGETSASAALLNQNQSGHIPLPAVIGISPRGDKAAK